MRCIAEGGESCLTSGDRREPEDSDVYITSSPRSAKPSEGKRSVGECAVMEEWQSIKMLMKCLKSWVYELVLILTNTGSHSDVIIAIV